MWDAGYVWQLVELHGSRVQPWTRSFVDAGLRRRGPTVAIEQRATSWSSTRNSPNKTNRARLRRGAKDKRVQGWIGLRELDYRLPQVRTLVEDIQRAESGEADPDVGY